MGLHISKDLNCGQRLIVPEFFPAISRCESGDEFWSFLKVGKVT